MASAGVDPNDGQVRKEIDCLDKLVRGGSSALQAARAGAEFGDVDLGPATMLASSGPTPGPGQARLVVFSAAGGWLVLWGLGLWLCLRRKRETRADAVLGERGTPRV